MDLQNSNQNENSQFEQIKSLLTELDIKDAQKKGYLKTAKNNPQLVIDQLEAFKQYQADFNSEFVDLYNIDNNEF